jgi:hypothetical protein
LRIQLTIPGSVAFRNSLTPHIARRHAWA